MKACDPSHDVELDNFIQLFVVSFHLIHTRLYISCAIWSVHVLWVDFLYHALLFPIVWVGTAHSHVTTPPVVLACFFCLCAFISICCSGVMFSHFASFCSIVFDVLELLVAFCDFLTMVCYRLVRLPHWHGSEGRRRRIEWDYNIGMCPVPCHLVTWCCVDALSFCCSFNSWTLYWLGFVQALHIYLNSWSMCIALIEDVHSIYLVSRCISGENCK